MSESDATKPVSAEEVAHAIRRCELMSEGSGLWLAALLQRLAQERDELRRIRELCIKALCRATGDSRDAIEDAPLTRAIKAQERLAAAEAALSAERAAREAAQRENERGTVTMLTSLVERAYGIFTASGVLRVAEQDPQSNDPIIAWASDVRSILYRSKPAPIDSMLRAVDAARGKQT